MPSAISARGLGSRWLSCENSTSASELDSLSCASVETEDEIDPPTPTATARQAIAKIDKQRMNDLWELVACEKTGVVARSGARTGARSCVRGHNNIIQRSHELFVCRKGEAGALIECKQ